MTKRTAVATLCAVLAGASGLSAEDARAHPLAPSLLELREEAPRRFAVTWKTPRRAEGGVLQPILPAGCRLVGTPRADADDVARVVIGEVACERDVVGERIAVAGLAAASSPVLVRLALRDRAPVQQVLRPGDEALVVPSAATAADVAWGHVKLGAEHIAGGFDHLLFLLGLFLLAPTWRALAACVTAFTVGHGLTLSWAALTAATLPGAAIEASIALSIVLLAGELTRRPDERPSLLARRPWSLTCGFGLLHGLGFAGALAEVGLPADAVVPALLGFNAGVELGQLAFVLLLAAGWRVASRRLARWRAARVGLAYAIGSVAALLLVERVLLAGRLALVR